MYKRADCMEDVLGIPFLGGIAMYIQDEHKIWLATGDNRVYLEPSMANRHGLIAGATGTGKTVTLRCLPKAFPIWAFPYFLPTSRVT